MWIALLLITGLFAQAKEKPREITVTGCLEGSYLRVTTTDTSGTWVDKFRLRGNKDRLKALTKDHKGHQVEITGLLNDPDHVMGSGKTVQVGKKTTITTQGRELAPPSPGREPEIDVKSYTHVSNTCR